MFKILKKTKTGIRLGSLRTAHGILATPFYMPDATRGFIKLADNNEIKKNQFDLKEEFNPHEITIHARRC